MKYNECLDLIEKSRSFRPTHSAIAKILDCKPNALVNRSARDGNIKDEEVKKIEHYYAIKLLGLTTTDCVELVYYPDVNASAGFGCEVMSENCEKMLVAKNQILNYSSHKTYSIVKALGNSMNPYLLSGDKLIIEHVEDNTIIDDNVYVFQYEGNTYVKRLIKNVNELVIKSDNPDKETYRTQYVQKEEMNKVKIIGKYIGLVRTVEGTV